MYTTLCDPHPIRYMRVRLFWAYTLGMRQQVSPVSFVFIYDIFIFFLSLLCAIVPNRLSLMLGSILSSGLLIDQKLSSQTS